MVRQAEKVYRLKARQWCALRAAKPFEGNPSTVARTIRDRRLARCGEMADASVFAHAITEIAHLWGFSYSRHFSSAFKQRYGLGPRDYRNMISLH